MTANAIPASGGSTAGGPTEKPISRLILGAIGVVFGDIGTSPLYAMKESFFGPHPLEADPAHVLGVLSLVFWSVMAIVSFKYVSLIMRADNKGEGGSLALLALVTRITQGSPLAGVVSVLGIFAAALFYGDSMITPAISVLSAVEGLELVTPALKPVVVPITLGILVALFAIQRHGTGQVGALFGPIMAVWFLALAGFGIAGIVQRPDVLLALNPYYMVQFFVLDGWKAFLALGSVVLAVTGAEALYTDMGHFGRKPIRYGWFLLILPALMLNYMGQGALLIAGQDVGGNPFFSLAPDWALVPLVGLATLATVIASQAVISGAFSVTKQAMQLGFLPRLKVKHTSSDEIGQIYLPFVNWMLMVFVAALVLGFGTSSSLAAAYGIAVTGTMLIDALLIGIVIFRLWQWPVLWGSLLLAVLLIIDGSFFAANATKIAHGGWFPLAIAAVIFTMLTTWKRGRFLVFERLRADAMPIDLFFQSRIEKLHRVPGTAIYMTGSSEGMPISLLHNLKHYKVLHQRNILVTVMTEDVPHVPSVERAEASSIAPGFLRVVLRYGFMDSVDVPLALRMTPSLGEPFNPADTSYFLSRETIIPSIRPGMMRWREALFTWMVRNASTAMDFFKLPTNRVVEVGTQIEI